MLTHARGHRHTHIYTHIHTYTHTHTHILTHAGYINPSEVTLLPETGMYRNLDVDRGVLRAQQRLEMIQERFDREAFILGFSQKRAGTNKRPRNSNRTQNRVRPQARQTRRKKTTHAEAARIAASFDSDSGGSDSDNDGDEDR